MYEHTFHAFLAIAFTMLVFEGHKIEIRAFHNNSY